MLANNAYQRSVTSNRAVLKAVSVFRRLASNIAPSTSFANWEDSNFGNEVEPLIIESVVDLRPYIGTNKVLELFANNELHTVHNFAKAKPKFEIVLERWLIEVSNDEFVGSIEQLEESISKFVMSRPSKFITDDGLSVKYKVISRNATISSRGRYGLRRKFDKDDMPCFERQSFMGFNSEIGTVSVGVSFRSNCKFSLKSSPPPTPSSISSNVSLAALLRTRRRSVKASSPVAVSPAAVPVSSASSPAFGASAFSGAPASGASGAFGTPAFANAAVANANISAASAAITMSSITDEDDNSIRYSSSFKTRSSIGSVVSSVASDADGLREFLKLVDASSTYSFKSEHLTETSSLDTFKSVNVETQEVCNLVESKFKKNRKSSVNNREDFFLKTVKKHLGPDGGKHFGLESARNISFNSAVFDDDY